LHGKNKVEIHTFWDTTFSIEIYDTTSACGMGYPFTKTKNYDKYFAFVSSSLINEILNTICILKLSKGIKRLFY